MDHCVAFHTLFRSREIRFSWSTRAQGNDCQAISIKLLRTKCLFANHQNSHLTPSMIKKRTSKNLRKQKPNKSSTNRPTQISGEIVCRNRWTESLNPNNRKHSGQKQSITSGKYFDKYERIRVNRCLASVGSVSSKGKTIKMDTRINILCGIYFMLAALTGNLLTNCVNSDEECLNCRRRLWLPPTVSMSDILINFNWSKPFNHHRPLDGLAQKPLQDENDRKLWNDKSDYRKCQQRSS